jgi:Zn-dependent M28 family amino/carboxypeptidase
MLLNQISPRWIPALIFAVALPAAAQLSDPQSDPLARIREAAKTNVQACSTTGETLCEQVAPKIIANAQGDSPLTKNLRSLREISDARSIDTPVTARLEEWAISTFRDAGINAHIEKYTNFDGSQPDQENVIADIPGREKPEEWVLVGAHLNSWAEGPAAAGNYCGAAMVIEAARDILRTGIRPRRSIRFVLFGGGDKRLPSSWAYVRLHRDELDRARGSIIFDSGCTEVAGYILNGRHDIERGMRDAMKPIDSLGAGNFFWEAVLGDNFDFLLEGVPTATTIQVKVGYVHDPAYEASTFDQNEIAGLKRNTAVVAITAFGIAERAEPLGPRQSRSEIESLLKATGLDERMKVTGLWPLWESGQRGRLP